MNLRRRFPHKGVERLVMLALAQGWRVERTGTGHLRFVPPDKDNPAVIVPFTPSDHRSLLNSTSQLRRSGLHVPRK